MDKEKLLPWIEKLTAATAKGERTAIVAEMCKENGIKVADGWKFLREAGFDPKVKPPENTGGPPTNETPQGSAQVQEGTPPNNDTQSENKQGNNGSSGADDKPPENTGGQGTGTGTGPASPTPPVPSKKRIRHDGLKGKKLTVLQDLVSFDENGIVELDAAAADFLLSIPGYTEVTE
jgi:hypothetical protein